MSHPFRKMTNQELKKLLHDDRERDQSLMFPSAHQAEAVQKIPPLINQPFPNRQQSESLNQ